MAYIKTNTKKVIEMRIRMGLVGAELARRVGCSATMINTLEKGRVNPGPALAVRIAEELGAEYDELFEIVEDE